jgi:hypothetical protein
MPTWDRQSQGWTQTILSSDSGRSNGAKIKRGKNRSKQFQIHAAPILSRHPSPSCMLYTISSCQLLYFITIAHL